MGEDLDRGRIYLPLDELAAFGVTPEQVRARRVDDNWREALAEQIGRVRLLQAHIQETGSIEEGLRLYGRASGHSQEQTFVDRVMAEHAQLARVAGHRLQATGRLSPE